MKIDEYLDANELVNIVNETLNNNEQIKILKRTENSKSDSHTNFVDIEDDSYDISEIEDEEVVECSQFSVINVTSMVNDKEKCNDSTFKVDTTQPSTSKGHDLYHVTIEHSQTDSDDDNDDVTKETIIPRVAVD